MGVHHSKPVQASLVKRRKQARPGEIIEACLLEFAQKGFAATRLDDVARRAGITKGTIYRYFEDKEALFLAAVTSRVSLTFDHMNEMISAFEDTTRELLIVMFKTVHNNLVHGDMHVLLRIILMEGKNFPDLPALYHREGISKGQKILKRIIARGIERGEIRQGAAADLPMVLMAPALMAAIWKMMFEEQQPVDPQMFFDAHVDLVLNGILSG